MGYTKPKETTRWHLENAPLPNHGESYTVISHGEVIENTYKLLSDSGFMVSREMYRSSKNANIAQGVYHIYPTNPTDGDIIMEKELGMMFAWTNSYNKLVKFQCAIGAYVRVCYNGMVAGDMMNFKRKHTGTANLDCSMNIADQVKNAEKYYKRIIKDKDAMKLISLTEQDQAELVGRMFIQEELIDSQQTSIIKSELGKPSFHYGSSSDTCWTFYNHVTHALKKAHPRYWLQDSQNFHDFIVAECLSSSKPTLNKETKLSEKVIVISDPVNKVVEVDEDITDTQLIENVFLD